MQLAVYDGLAEYANKVEAVRKKCGDVRRELTKKHFQTKLPAYCNDTRWCSTFTMVKVIVKVKDKVEHVMDTSVWSFAETMVKVLKPFSNLTTKLQADQCLFGDLVRDLTICSVKVKKWTEISQKVSISVLKSGNYWTLKICQCKPPSFWITVTPLSITDTSPKNIKKPSFNISFI